MTPRFDIFLAAALQGLLANPAITDYTTEDYNNHAYAIARDMVNLSADKDRQQMAECYCNHSIKPKTDNNDN